MGCKVGNTLAHRTSQVHIGLERAAAVMRSRRLEGVRHMAAVDFEDVREAAARIDGIVAYTPVLTSPALDSMAGRRLFFKCENLQRCGAFKFRGALNAVLALSEEDAARGVVTDSSGNHGQALAEAARIRAASAARARSAEAAPG